MVEQDPNAGLLTPVGVPVGEALGAATAEGFGPNGIPADVSADPVMEPPGTANFADTETRRDDRQRGGHRGRHHRRGGRQRVAGPAAVQPRSRPHAGDGQLASAAPSSPRCCARRGTGCRLGTRRARCWWCPPPAGSTRARSSCSGPPTSRRPADEPGGGIGFADVGAAPAWRNLRAPMSAIPRDATRIRLVATDDDLVPAALDRDHAAAHPAAAHPAGRRRLAGPGAAGLAGRHGLPVPAPVRPPVRRRRGAEVAHPARPVRRRGQLAGDGQPRRRAARHHRTAAAARPPCRPI